MKERYSPTQESELPHEELPESKDRSAEDKGDIPPSEKTLIHTRTALQKEFQSHILQSWHGLRKEAPSQSDKELFRSEALFRLLETLQFGQKIGDKLFVTDYHDVKPDQLIAELESCPELSEEAKNAAELFIRNYLNNCETTTAIMGKIDAKDKYHSMVGRNPDGAIVQSQSFDSIEWIFTNEDDMKAFFEADFSQSNIHDPAEKAKNTGGMVTDLNERGLNVRLIVFCQEQGEKETQSNTKTHEYAHIVYRKTASSITLPLAEQLEQKNQIRPKEFFDVVFDRWLEAYKNEALAYLAGDMDEPLEAEEEHVAFDLSALYDFQSKDKLYDYPEENFEDIFKLYKKNFSNEKEFNALYQMRKEEYRKRATEMSRDIIKLFGTELGDEDKTEESYLHQSGIQDSRRMLNLFLAYPAAQWPRLISRLRKLADQGEELRHSFDELNEEDAAYNVEEKLTNEYCDLEDKLAKKTAGAILELSSDEWEGAVEDIAKAQPDVAPEEYDRIKRLALKIQNKEDNLMFKVMPNMSKKIYRKITYYDKSTGILDADLAIQYHHLIFQNVHSMEQKVKDIVNLKKEATKRLLEIDQKTIA